MLLRAVQQLQGTTFIVGSVNLYLKKQKEWIVKCSSHVACVDRLLRQACPTSATASVSTHLQLTRKNCIGPRHRQACHICDASTPATRLMSTART